MNGHPESQTYIARADCGCIKLVMSIYKGRKPHKHFVENLAWAMSEGYGIERVPTEYVREHFTSHCDICCPAVPEQTSLLIAQTEVS